MGGMGAAAGAEDSGAGAAGAAEAAVSAWGAGAGSVFRFLLSRFITWAVLLVLESLFEAITNAPSCKNYRFLRRGNLSPATALTIFCRSRAEVASGL